MPPPLPAAGVDTARSCKQDGLWTQPGGSQQAGREHCRQCSKWEPRASWLMSWAWGTKRRVLCSGHRIHASTWRIHSQLIFPLSHQHSCPADGQTEAQRGEAAPGGGEPRQKLQSFCMAGKETCWSQATQHQHMLCSRPMALPRPCITP